MSGLQNFPAGNYSFLPSGAFSAGVVPDAGFALHRVRFTRPIPLQAGFAAIEAYLEGLGRPVTALAGCEIRSPRPMSAAEFDAFNAIYVATLHEWGCRLGTVNAPARSNLAPITEIPTEPMFYGFTHTVPEAGATGDFLLSGLPEIVPGVPLAQRSFGGRNVTLRGLEAKARYVMEELRRRVDLFGCDWNAITGVQVYCPHDIRPLLEGLFAEMGLSQLGVAWFPAWPPVDDMDFEADLRRVRTEKVI